MTSADEASLEVLVSGRIPVTLFHTDCRPGKAKLVCRAAE